jgi:hypothetical protein
MKGVKNTKEQKNINEFQLHALVFYNIAFERLFKRSSEVASTQFFIVCFREAGVRYATANCEWNNLL